MFGVEIGDSSIQRRIPGVNNVAERIIRTDFAGAFGVGAQVNRLRQGVTKIHLQTMAEGMTQGELTGIVVTHADGGPGIEGGKLGLPEF